MRPSRLVPTALLAAVLAFTALSAAPARGSPAGGWFTYGGDVHRSGFSGSETILTPATVGGLGVAWSTPLGAATITSPIVVPDVPTTDGPRTLVFVGTEHGDLFAIDAATGGVVWQRNLGSVQIECSDMPDGVFGIGGTPVYEPATRRLYVAANDDVTGVVRLHALDAASGDAAPGWPVAIDADAAHTHVWGALTLHRGVVYVTTAGMCDAPPYYGRVIAVDVSDAAVVGTFTVVHDGDGVGQGGGIWGWGGASIGTDDGSVYVATGNALEPLPQGQPYAESVVRLGPGRLVGQVRASNFPGRLVGADVDFGATPLLFRNPGCPAQLAALNKVGVLVLYMRDSIEAGPVQRVRLDQNLHAMGRLMGIPAFSPVTHLLYVSNPGPDREPFLHGMVALRETAACTLRLAWQQAVGPNGTSPVSTPTVAGGVVYYGDGIGSRVFAFDAATGRRLWNSRDLLPGPVFAAPVVVGGRLYVTSWSDDGGTLTAFELER